MPTLYWGPWLAKIRYGGPEFNPQYVLSAPIFLECRSAPAPYQKKEWHSHIAPFEKREWHSLIAPS
jgi:hypothetical protein